MTRIRERARLGVDDFVFFPHDRGELGTLRLIAEEILPALRDA